MREERISFQGSEGEVEEPREGGRRNRKEAAAGSDSAGSESPSSESPSSDAVTRAALSSEVVHAGKDDTGRTFGMRALLRE